jgi:hypothetical protein
MPGTAHFEAHQDVFDGLVIRDVFHFVVEDRIACRALWPSLLLTPTLETEKADGVPTLESLRTMVIHVVAIHADRTTQSLHCFINIYT